MVMEEPTGVLAVQIVVMPQSPAPTVYCFPGPLPPSRCSRFGAVAADGYGLGYNIDGDVITIPVTAFRVGDTDGKLMAKELERALREIGDVCR